MRVVHVFSLVFASFVPAYGQLLLGNISGTVTDAQGAVIGGAKIEVKNVDTNLKINAETQVNGLYQVANLAIGNYTVTVEREGFDKQVFTEILVQANRTTTINAELRVGTVSTQIEVTGTPLRNETDATNGYVLDSSTIQNTPLGTGSFTQLAILSPGVNADFLAGSGTNAGLGNQNIWSNGQRDTSNSFSINAVSANNLFNGKSSSQVSESRFTLNTGSFTVSHAGGDVQTSTSVYNAIGQGLPTPAQESIEELRVNTAQYDASQGGSSGAQIALITRSGGNQLHGQVYEYVQNKVLNAAPFFRNADSTISAHDKVPTLHYNRFGATLGGPVIKDKIFFFGSYQGVRDTDGLGSNSYATVPAHLTDDRSPAALSAVAQQDFNQTIASSAIDPVAQKLLNFKVNGHYLIPSPTITDPKVAAQLNYNTLITGPPSTFSQDQANANVDWNFSPADRFSAKYFRSDNPGVSPFGQATVVGFPQSLQAGSDVVSLNNTYVVQPEPHLGAAGRLHPPEGVLDHRPVAHARRGRHQLVRQRPIPQFDYLPGGWILAQQHHRRAEEQLRQCGSFPESLHMEFQRQLGGRPAHFVFRLLDGRHPAQHHQPEQPGCDHGIPDVRGFPAWLAAEHQLLVLLQRHQQPVLPGLASRSLRSGQHQGGKKPERQRRPPV